MKRYIFVGGFGEGGKDGSTGGQTTACRSLIASPLSHHIEWRLIDTTGDSIPPPPAHRRAIRAWRRLLELARSLAFHHVDGALIFTGAAPSFLEKGLMAMAAKRAGKRVVLCPRSGLLVDAIERSPAMRGYVRRVLSHCDAVVCQSESWQRLFGDLSGLPKKRLPILSNWIDTSPYGELIAARGDGASSSGQMRFLYLGALEPYKGILDLVAAAKRVAREIPEATFTVCGDGSAMIEVRARIADGGLDDRFDFRGWVGGREKLRALGEADVLVLPSHREGMPNAVLEAMASGVAVVASAVGGVPDLLAGGELGMCVPAKDPHALGEAMVALARDPQRRRVLAQRAADRIAAHHDIATVWPRMLAILDPPG
ncbi:MAG TPA: glycosyltransferase family 4 protein [Kofleriaceae bacterium]|nr:glycosyltransferase family 4 protein [Kofleriaceae bacterium]